jgi:RNA polymerase sigma-70 factor (ECF subfamily)
MEALLQGAPDDQRIAFAKLNRLLSGFLTDLRAWDYRDDWEDLRQIVVMKLISSCSQGQVREFKTFAAYARTITRNEFFDFLQVRLGKDVEALPDVGGGESLDEVTLLSVRSAVQNLPEEQQRVVQAVYVEGKTYEEAAAATAIPLGSLKRYLRLALTRLREQLFEAE